MKGQLHGYSSVYAIGHSALGDLFLDPVVVEEEIDGSQYSFGVIGGEYACRSKGKDQTPPLTDKMFALAVEQTKGLPLHEGWTYRGGYLAKPKHNALSYSRVPANNVVIFDVDTATESYLPPREKASECARIGLECVPALFHGTVSDWDAVRGLLSTISILGGCLIEGVVVKNYARFGGDKKTLMGKFVSEKYKEVQGAEWKRANPVMGDIVEQLVARYRTEPRWEKAVQHLRENGQLQGSPRDIGALIPEVRADVLRECEQEIRDILFRYAWPKVERRIISGLPEWYKEKLAQSAFGDA